MKLTAPAGKLADALDLTRLPIDDPKVRKIASLSAAHIAADDDQITIRSNVLDFAVSSTAAVAIEEPGEAAVPGERLAGLVAALPPDATVAVTASEKIVTVACGRGRWRLPALPLDHLPKPLAVGEPLSLIELEAAAALRLFERPAFAMSGEPTRYCLCGILLHTVDDELRAVATDGARLARVGVPAAAFSDDHSLIVPRRAVAIICKLMKRTRPDTVTLRRWRTLFELATPRLGFTTKLVDGSYPDYERITPKLSTSHATVNRRELAQALERLRALVDGELKVAAIVGLMWSGNGALRLGLPRQRGSADDIIDAEASGECQIAIALGQLAELVDEFKGQNLRMHVGGAMEPMIVVDPDDAGITILQMPMMWTFTQESEAA